MVALYYFLLYGVPLALNPLLSIPFLMAQIPSFYLKAASGIAFLSLFKVILWSQRSRIMFMTQGCFFLWCPSTTWAVDSSTFLMFHSPSSVQWIILQDWRFIAATRRSCSLSKSKWIHVWVALILNFNFRLVKKKLCQHLDMALLLLDLKHLGSRIVDLVMDQSI